MIPRAKLIAYILGGLVVASVPAYLIVTGNESINIVPSSIIIPNPPNSVAENRSCEGNEKITYEIKNKSIDIYHPEYYAQVLVRHNDGYNNEFTIEDIAYEYGPVEIHRCNIYVIRRINYDYKLDKLGSNGYISVWKFPAIKIGENLITLSSKDAVGTFKSNYSYEFRISPDEKYIALIRSYLGEDDHALIIKSLDTRQDTFILPLIEIIKQYKNGEGYIGLSDWTKDGKYFWGNTFVGANVYSFFRIERDTWKVNVFPAPENTMGGDALNIEKGYVTHDTLGTWSGSTEFDQDTKEQYQREGKTGVFALYNLFTKQEIVLEKATDPTYFFRPKWISDTQLQYYLPSGEIKVYIVK